MMRESRNRVLLPCLQVAGRLVLAVHFASEALDKILHWSQWVEVIRDAHFPVPSAMLMLVVALLMMGTPLLVTGVYPRCAVGALLLFQIPTTLFFETTWYEQADSISVMGGLLLVLALDELQKEAVEVAQQLPGEELLLLDPSAPDSRIPVEAEPENDTNIRIMPQPANE